MAQYMYNPALDPGNADDGWKTNKEIIDQLHSNDLISDRDYEVFNQWFNGPNSEGAPHDPNSTSFAQARNPNTLINAIVGDTQLDPGFAERLTGTINALFVNPADHPNSNPSDHSSYIDENGNFVGLPVQDYGPVDFGQGLLSEGQFNALNERGLVRPMILPAANSGQASWAQWQERYNNPEYGGLLAAQQYLQDHEQMQKISPYLGNAWSPSWIELQSQPTNPTVPGGVPPAGGGGQPPAGGGGQAPVPGGPSPRTPGQNINPVDAGLLSLGAGSRTGVSYRPPIYNHATGEYEYDVQDIPQGEYLDRKMQGYQGTSTQMRLTPQQLAALEAYRGSLI